METRLLPTGTCWCGCGQTLDLGSFFAPGHDKKAESRVIMEVFGGVPRFVATFGYAPGSKQSVGSSWIDHVMRLRLVGASVRARCCLEYRSTDNRAGRLERTDFNVELLLPQNLDGSLSLVEGAVKFKVPRGNVGHFIEVPFVDFSAVYQVSAPGPYWVARVSGALDPSGQTLKYVAFGTEEPRAQTALGMSRLVELGPLKEAAREAWERIHLRWLPAFYVHPTDHLALDAKRVFEWPNFDEAASMISIDDVVLTEQCETFKTKLKAVDRCWFSARAQLNTYGNPGPDIPTIWWQVTESVWGSTKGEKILEDAHTAYVTLLRQIDRLLDV